MFLDIEVPVFHQFLNAECRSPFGVLSTEHGMDGKPPTPKNDYLMKIATASN